MSGGVDGRSGTAVFCENLVAICTHVWMANFISTTSLVIAYGLRNRNLVYWLSGMSERRTANPTVNKRRQRMAAWCAAL